MSPRASSPPPRASTPEPTLQPLPSPRMRPSRSFTQLKSITTTPLSSHKQFHLTFDEFGTDHRRLPLPDATPSPTFTVSSPERSKMPTTHTRPRRKSGPAPPQSQNSMHKLPRRSGSPPPPAHHHPTPPPPLPPLPSFLISAAHKSPNSYGFDIPTVSIFPSPVNEPVNPRCYPIRHSH
ncbi:hypothetical protein BJ322DRAFT_183128 [Thelephora terrestris]|uniref:Uncharacterized protein n=1 Tax=Thelephora terrestris TaxID=56493 RepID=A0A9P6HAK7_9AGAM|nr:hypothetical protein BJ322DRAFT_183128 [Thelephora terrestris]